MDWLPSQDERLNYVVMATYRTLDEVIGLSMM